jgi:uncharacterized membrane protein
MEKTSMNLDENIAGVLCYILIWVTGIIFYIMEKKNKTVRFHAMQSILTFLPMTILTWILNWLGSPSWSPGGYYGSWNPGIPALLWLSWLIGIIMLVLWLILMFKAYQGEKFKLPIVGDIAEKKA